MNVLYLADRDNPDHYYPLGPYVEEALRERHDLRFLDLSQPFDGQLDGAEAVIDDGLIENSEQVVETATDLKLWQVAKTGFDDVTRQIMNARRIGLMKRDAYLVNVARGGLVDQEALFAALADGKIAGAGLDVFAEEPPDPSHPAFRLPNLLVTPHIAGSTNGTFRNRGRLMAENLSRVASGHEPLYRVDA
jgi:lactate dehydrogenase-like 2-hydroxyacid dehydrogenase